ncbi:ATP-binding protein, partial [Streptomyces sp. CPS1]
MGPHPAVAAIRLAVRRVLHDILNDLPAPGDGHPATVGHPGRTAERPPSPLVPSPAASSAPPAPPLVLVACSGGADSMALASALAFEAPKLGLRAGGITVDHGLQPGSDLRAEEVALRMRGLGLD